MIAISIVIPVRNMAATLARAVESALKSDDVIIVYDASEDDTFQVVQDLCTWYPNVRYITPLSAVPIGVCAARNIGVSQARNNLIIPLDADDYFLPGGIEALMSAWEEGTFVYGGWELDTGQVIDPPQIEMLYRKNVTQATFLFAKLDFIRAGGYDPLFTLGAEDYAFMCALVRAGIRGTRISQPVYHYTDHPNGRAANCQRRWPLVQQLLKEQGVPTDLHSTAR